MRALLATLFVVLLVGSCGLFEFTGSNNNSKRVIALKPKICKTSKLLILPILENEKEALNKGLEVLDKSALEQIFKLERKERLDLLSLFYQEKREACAA